MKGTLSWNPRNLSLVLPPATMPLRRPHASPLRDRGNKNSASASTHQLCPRRRVQQSARALYRRQSHPSRASARARSSVRNRPERVPLPYHGIRQSIHRHHDSARRRAVLNWRVSHCQMSPGCPASVVPRAVAPRALRRRQRLHRRQLNHSSVPPLMRRPRHEHHTIRYRRDRISVPPLSRVHHLSHPVATGRTHHPHRRSGRLSLPRPNRTMYPILVPARLRPQKRAHQVHQARLTPGHPRVLWMAPLRQPCQIYQPLPSITSQTAAYTLRRPVATHILFRPPTSASSMKTRCTLIHRQPRPRSQDAPLRDHSRRIVRPRHRIHLNSVRRQRLRLQLVAFRLPNLPAFLLCHLYPLALPRLWSLRGSGFQSLRNCHLCPRSITAPVLCNDTSAIFRRRTPMLRPSSGLTAKPARQILALLLLVASLAHVVNDSVHYERSEKVAVCTGLTERQRGDSVVCEV